MDSLEMARQIKEEQATHLQPKENVHYALDRLEMAEQIKKTLENFDIELNCEGGPDLIEKYRLCKKNPGHLKFIHVNDFKMEDLPPEYRDDVMYNYMKVKADLTVRVNGNHISENRPEKFPEVPEPYNSLSGIPYWSSEHRGTDISFVGTGSVRGVSRKSTETGDGPCSCSECKSSTTPRQQWGEIRIGTAKHVVFDDVEACNTTCDFFYVSDDRAGVFTVEGKGMNLSVIELDVSVFHCVTHNTELIQKLEHLFSCCRDLEKQLDKKMRRLQDHHSVNNSPVVIVSHPHGCRKQISVGELVAPNEGSPPYYTYTAATCQGSSGAPVFPLKMCLHWGAVHSSTKKFDVNMGGGLAPPVKIWEFDVDGKNAYPIELSPSVDSNTDKTPLEMKDVR